MLYFGLTLDGFTHIHQGYFTDLVHALNLSHTLIQDPNFVITVPADGPAPNGAGPSAGTVIMIN